MESAGTREDATDTAAIELIGVVKTFHSRGETVTAVRGVDLSIAQGEFFALLGPSGCGKTTTLRMIAGFDDPSAGRLLLHGRPVMGVPPNRRDVNMVFQSYALFPHMNVFDNVAFGLRRKGLARAEIGRRVAEMLELVELSGRERRRPRELSGGQQQRIALARALVNRPRALLLDEPLGALDLKLRQAMQVELKRIQREVGITFVYVTHDQGEALTMSDRIGVMNDGVIEQLGTPQEIYEHPASRFVAGFIGTSNLLTGRVSRFESRAEGPDQGTDAVIDIGDGERILVPVNGRTPGGRTLGGRAVADGDEIELTVRPEKIEIRGEPPAGRLCALRGTVTEVIYLGTATSYNVTTSTGADMVVFTQNTSSAGGIASRGDSVWLSWDPLRSYPIGG
jgi:spermidine/putrescine transport system ATP-binding protein